jgi:ribosomal protein S18 acetylase RimI-like enzyme
MPDEYLEGLQPEERVAMWRGRISRTELPPLLVAELSGDVVGFAAFGPAQPGLDSSGVGQLYAVNLDPAHWRKGIGRALLRNVTTALTAMKFREAVLWVVPENVRARALYEAEGWTEDGGVRTEEVLGATVAEVRYRRQLAG